MARKLLKPLLISCFCICAAWFAAKIAIFFLAPSPLPAIFPQVGDKFTANPNMERAERPIPVYGDAIRVRNLFHIPLEPASGQNAGDGGTSGPEGLAAQEALLRAEMDKLPIHKQGWLLLGTVVDTIIPSRSRAMLAIENRQGAYGPGEEINGWKIALIERRAVALEKNGRREKLLVGGRKIDAPPSAAPAFGKRSIEAKDIHRAMSDLPQLMKEASFSPAQKNGVYGINLTSLKPDGFLSRLGLKQDDLLTGANGQSLGSLGDLANLGDLARMDSLRLELVRNGQNMVLEYDIHR